MITVVIPTLEAEATLGATLASLVPAAIDGLVRQVIVVDSGSTDRTLKIAEDAGADIVRAEPGRGRAMMAGAAAARYPWLLFLHADTVLASGWESEVAALIERVASGARPLTAAAFRFALDDTGFFPRLLELGVVVRCALFRLPYGDQGLLIPRRLYDQVGGYRPLPLMEDVDLIRRLGRSRTLILRTSAVTSALRYKREGYLVRAARNLSCVGLFYLRAPMPLIERLYTPARKA
ncbi:MAG TPA: TIGR04283 family arsenosugar biosynthesis glycosyltransferase [Hyphomicrobiaceae bacterium]|nr:TIGR04283 family arsenosugar biosynthesis glycosyltransferase [Hyphomicrobiaceae bacterium]